MVVAQLIAQVIALALVALLGAAILRVATRAVAGFSPPYWQAYAATIAGYIVSFVASLFLITAVGIGGQSLDAGGIVLMSVVGFFAQAGVYTGILKGPSAQALAFGRACLVSLVQLVLGAVALLVCGLLLWAVAEFRSRLAPQTTYYPPPPSFGPPPPQSARTEFPAPSPAAAVAQATPSAEQSQTTTASDPKLETGVPVATPRVESTKPLVRKMPSSEFSNVSLYFTSRPPTAGGEFRNKTDWYITAATITVSREYERLQGPLMSVISPRGDSRTFELKLPTGTIAPFSNGEFTVGIGDYLNQVSTIQYNTKHTFRAIPHVQFETISGYPR